ncbi:bis(5'-nucleosyl)-tetraphosphatase [Agrilactobacillus yilanensis]|uniref:Bis(5'-nucleosyl)-tetraphosphatase [asymmetrical] n=1 Tax=Agrilactobacillus yilanensis TaxID=2485997 RepID=A0ABW4J9X8_9LACO|nr:NUDIX domain-containing protein [Agrilactobacillus yilanensis]
MTEYEVATGAVIYSRIAGKLQYLLVESKDRHFWGFAKGHVEAGETKEQAAIREIKEETNLDVTVDMNFTEEIRYPLPNGKTKVSIFYVSEVAPTVETTKQLAEISAIRWFDYEDALAKLTYDNLKNVLIKANQYLTRT